jgi:aspartyl-tRNA(Asn)/glutamyl-tRNA(Gln) amidotransferase subunit A
MVAFKQTLGLVPHDLTPDGFGNQSCIMPITRAVMDCALWTRFDAAGEGRHRPAAARAAGDLKGPRIAWRPYLGNHKVAREVLALCEAAVGLLGQLGAVVEPMEDDFENTEPVWLVLTQSFWNARFRRYVREFGSRMSTTLLRQMDEGAHYSTTELQEAMFEMARPWAQRTPPAAW